MIATSGGSNAPSSPVDCHGRLAVQDDLATRIEHSNVRTVYPNLESSTRSLVKASCNIETIEDLVSYCIVLKGSF